MGLETASNEVGRIDPNSLIGHPDTSIVEPRATAALVDAFRNGVVTADDITNRLGEVAQLRKKAEVMGLKEQMSPEAQAARASGITAATAGNNLHAASATAALPGVPAVAKAAEEDVDFHRAATAYGPESIKSFFNYGPLVPGFSGVPKDADGKPDWMTVAKEGASLERQVQLKSQALLRSTVHKTEPRTEGNVTYNVDVNAAGEDITDPAKKQALNAQATAPLAFKFISVAPGATAAPTVSPNTTSTAPAAPVVTPLNPDEAARARANLVNQGNTAAAQMSDEQVSAMVQPKTAIPAPATVSMQPVAPASPKPDVMLNQYVPGKGQVSKMEFEKPADITKEIRGTEQYKEWAKANSFYDSAKSAIDVINTMPEAEKSKGSARLNANDIALTESVIKLYDPQGVVRQFKWDKIEQHQPWPDVLQNIVSKAVSRGALTPEMRQALAGIASDKMRSYEDNLRPQLQQAETISRRAGFDPLKDGILSPKEASILSGQGTPKYTTPGATPAGTAGPVVTLSNGQKVQRGADGQYYPAQ